MLTEIDQIDHSWEMTMEYDKLISITALITNDVLDVVYILGKTDIDLGRQFRTIYLTNGYYFPI